MMVTLVVCTATVAFADVEAGSAMGAGEADNLNMTNTLIDYGVRLAFALIMTLIGVLGTWLGTLTAKNKKMQNTAQAIKELTKSVKTTVGSLQQTVVEKLKEAHEDHKLTEAEIYELGVMLKEKAIEKLSQPTKDALEAASVDVELWITDTAESWINKLKSESGMIIGEIAERQNNKRNKPRPEKTGRGISAFRNKTGEKVDTMKKNQDKNKKLNIEKTPKFGRFLFGSPCWTRNIKCTFDNVLECLKKCLYIDILQTSFRKLVQYIMYRSITLVTLLVTHLHIEKGATRPFGIVMQVHHESKESSLLAAFRRASVLVPV